MNTTRPYTLMIRTWTDYDDEKKSLSSAAGGPRFYWGDWEKADTFKTLEDALDAADSAAWSEGFFFVFHRDFQFSILRDGKKAFCNCLHDRCLWCKNDHEEMGADFDIRVRKYGLDKLLSEDRQTSPGRRRKMIVERHQRSR